VHDVDALMADARADVARDALLLLRQNAEAAEPRVHVHERRERAREAAPHAAAEPEVEPESDDPAEKNVDRPRVVQKRNALEQRFGGARGPRAVAHRPAHDAKREDDECEREYDLADEVHAIPLRAVRHLLAMHVAERFGERAARAHPAAVDAFPPAV